MFTSLRRMALATMLPSRLYEVEIAVPTALAHACAADDLIWKLCQRKLNIVGGVTGDAEAEEGEWSSAVAHMPCVSCFFCLSGRSKAGRGM